MGVDCTIYSLDPETGAVDSRGLDRYWVFETYRVKREICAQLLNSKDALADLAAIRAYHHDDAEKTEERHSYCNHWIEEAVSFIARSPASYLFRILSENDSDPETLPERFAEDIIYAQWPRCTECGKKADNISRPDRSKRPEWIVAYCAHQCAEGATSLIWDWKPVGIPAWAIEARVNPAMYGKNFAE